MRINIFNNFNIILASGSPRRRELMTGMGIPFRVAEVYGVEEVYPDTLAAHDVPLFLARLKSEAYPKPLIDKEILITADTVVIHGGQVIGKPRDRQEAMQTLTRLSGSGHEVVTGVVIRDHGTHVAFSETTKVWFGPLMAEEIEHYVETYRPYDKAGAYGIQEWIGYMGIERIEGSFYNVMGLPTRLLYTRLIDFINTQYTDNQ